ncbi:MAG: hypothetical protein ABIE43_01795 [Patescibacteria group bacterium]
MSTLTEIKKCLAGKCAHCGEERKCQAGQKICITTKGKCSSILIAAGFFREGISVKTLIMDCQNISCTQHREAEKCALLKKGIHIGEDGKCSGFKKQFILTKKRKFIEVAPVVA